MRDLLRPACMTLLMLTVITGVLYPLTGGFSRPPLVPRRLAGALEALERLLSPLAPLLAFRCLVVLERRY